MLKTGGINNSRKPAPPPPREWGGAERTRGRNSVTRAQMSRRREEIPPTTLLSCFCASHRLTQKEVRGVQCVGAEGGRVYGDGEKCRTTSSDHGVKQELNSELTDSEPWSPAAAHTCPGSHTPRCMWGHPANKDSSLSLFCFL